MIAWIARSIRLPSRKVSRLSRSGKLSVWIKVLNYSALPILILITWDLLVRLQLFSPAILPSWERVLKTFGRLIANGELLKDLYISITRVVKGYSLALVAGIVFGILMGISTRANRFFVLTFDGIRQIPPLAWIPLIILWFGIDEASKVVIIFKSAFFPILLNTINGIHQVPKPYLEVAKLNNTKWYDLLRKLYIPAALPSVFVGLRLGLGASWMSMVAAELIASSSGIGYMINDGRELSKPDLVIVGMIVIGAVGVLMDFLLKKLARRMLSWQNTAH